MALKLPSSGYILGLDVGAKRIGVAVGSVIAQLPQPLEMIPAGESALDDICSVIKQHQAELVIIGIPRNMSGDETAQSAAIRAFASELAQQTDATIEFADESLSSVRADHMVSNKAYAYVSTDSLAACFILEEYFETHRSQRGSTE